MNKLAVILAAGRSSRFIDPKSKLLQTIGGSTIINRVVGAAIRANFSPVLILGHQREQILKVVEAEFSGLYECAIQEQPRGTGHAFYKAMPFIKEGSVLVMNGDSPLITPELLLNFAAFFHKNNLALATVSARAENPFGYGRMIPTKTKSFLIVEERDLAPEQKQINLINGGVYLFSSTFLQQHFAAFVEEKSRYAGEINITDLFNLAATLNLPMGHYEAPFKIISGVNNLQQYAEVQKLLDQDAC
jgi:bifunctional N-acetylglucosamine-1-phosphate-uridyltransferase/glucosamine-1-phosphate-acetyltransferase GlmU-like protein